MIVMGKGGRRKPDKRAETSSNSVIAKPGAPSGNNRLGHSDSGDYGRTLLGPRYEYWSTFSEESRSGGQHSREVQSATV